MTNEVNECSELLECLPLIQDNPTQFREGFQPYFITNFHLWSGFVERALQMVRTGRAHYSAKTIIQVLRFHSDLYEADSEFKVNDKWAADFGRLFMLRYPLHKGFFATKESAHRIRIEEAA